MQCLEVQGPPLLPPFASAARPQPAPKATALVPQPTAPAALPLEAALRAAAAAAAARKAAAEALLGGPDAEGRSDDVKDPEQPRPAEPASAGRAASAAAPAAVPKQEEAAVKPEEKLQTEVHDDAVDEDDEGMAEGLAAAEALYAAAREVSSRFCWVVRVAQWQIAQQALACSFLLL